MERTKKSKLKKQFPFLTDDDFNFAPDKKDALLNHLQITLGKTKGELEILLASL